MSMNISGTVVELYELPTIMGTSPTALVRDDETRTLVEVSLLPKRLYMSVVIGSRVATTAGELIDGSKPDRKRTQGATNTHLASDPATR